MYLFSPFITLFTRLERWYGRNIVLLFTSVLVVLLGASAYVLFAQHSIEETPKEDARKTVSVEKAASLLENGTTLRTVGTVRAVSEARLETEASGRITTVAVGIGDMVAAGTVVASIENTRERAALLQAEGAYESALSLNAQSNIGLTEANVGALNTYRAAYTTADDIVYNLIDELFANPFTDKPGFKVSSNGTAPALNTERMLYGALLKEWQEKTARTSEDYSILLDEAERDLTRLHTFVSSISFLVADEKPTATFSAEDLAQYKTRLGAARSRIDTTLSSLLNARTTLKNAKQSAQNGTMASESGARIKQALGTLRAAQAAYEKTLVRTPIRGTVNALYLKENEYVSQGQPAAVIANNNALEITTSISEEERALVAPGTSVRINGTWDGVVTRIAPGVDPQTGKIEVKVSVTADGEAEKLSNGTTVSLTINTIEKKTEDTTDLLLPISALKITPQGPTVFSVSEKQTLIALPVVIDTIIGDTVRIKEGIAADTVIVRDARGLKDGEAVIIK